MNIYSAVHKHNLRVGRLPPDLAHAPAQRGAVLVGAVEHVGAPQHDALLRAVEEVGLPRSPERSPGAHGVPAQPAERLGLKVLLGANPQPVAEV